MIQRNLLSLLLIALLGTGLCAAQSNETANYGVTNAANDLGLNTFSAALEGAGLVNILDNQGVLLFGSGSFAVFAPNDEAFANVTDIDIDSIMENKTDLERVLGYHVVWKSTALWRTRPI
ncbi:MAG: fasciclin domain-containing protein [Methanothrix sp.]|nr:fasciclin domain-containing protein [Methanothrix sp.]